MSSNAVESAARWRRVRKAAFVLGGLLLMALGGGLSALWWPRWGAWPTWLALLGGGLLIGGLWPARSERASRADRDTAQTPRPWSRVGNAYQTLAVILLNTFLAFAALNLLLAVTVDPSARAALSDDAIVSPLRRLPMVELARQTLAMRPGRVPVMALDDAALARVYPGLTREAVRQLTRETHDRPFRYDPFTQFREAQYSGRFIHVTPAGFRRGSDEAPWPPEPDRYVLWVFGGSTTFGYGLPDAETLPAQLERILRRRHPDARLRVYNFGQGSYYSAQELSLLTALLAENGRPPRRVVFFDGLNEHLSEPFDSGWLRDLLRHPLRAWLHRPEALSLGDGSQIVERWLRHKRLAEALSAASGITPLFVWQPTPDHGYDLRYHLLWDVRAGGSRPVLGHNPHYEAMATLLARDRARLGDDFLWLGDLQRGAQRPLYVDRLHYTAAFTTEIATRIADALERQR